MGCQPAVRSVRGPSRSSCTSPPLMGHCRCPAGRQVRRPVRPALRLIMQVATACGVAAAGCKLCVLQHGGGRSAAARISHAHSWQSALARRPAQHCRRPRQVAEVGTAPDGGGGGTRPATRPVPPPAGGRRGPSGAARSTRPPRGPWPAAAPPSAAPPGGARPTTTTPAAAGCCCCLPTGRTCGRSRAAAEHLPWGSSSRNHHL